MKRRKDESCLTRVLKYMFCRCSMRVDHHGDSEEDEEAQKQEDNSTTAFNIKALKGGDEVIISGTGQPFVQSEVTKMNNFSPEKRHGMPSMVSDKTIAPVQVQNLNLDPSVASIGFNKNANTPDSKVFGKEEKK